MIELTWIPKSLAPPLPMSEQIKATNRLLVQGDVAHVVLKSLCSA
jgi:hypothetical protein